MINFAFTFHGCIPSNVTSLAHVVLPSWRLMDMFPVAMKTKTRQMTQCFQTQWDCNVESSQKHQFKLLRWQIFPSSPDKAISHLITVGCDSSRISLEVTWWQEGMQWRMRRYYTDSHSNSLSGSETDDSELEKMKQPKIMSQSVLITNPNSHLHSSYTLELHRMLRINLHMLFLLSNTTNNVLGVHFNALYYHTTWNAVFC